MATAGPRLPIWAVTDAIITELPAVRRAGVAIVRAEPIATVEVVVSIGQGGGPVGLAFDAAAGVEVGAAVAVGARVGVGVGR